VLSVTNKAFMLNVIMLSVIMLSDLAPKSLCIMLEHCYAEYCLFLVNFVLSVTNKAFMLNVIMLSVVMLSVMAPNEGFNLFKLVSHFLPILIFAS
jgi:hypothetical protein